MHEAWGPHVHAVAVAKVDRWARSPQHLSATVNELHDLGVDFYAMDQGLAVRKGDPKAKLMLHKLAACAEWEASIISERTKEGLRDKIGKGRHRTGCGTDFPCPTDKHPKKGYPGRSARERLYPRGLPLVLKNRRSLIVALYPFDKRRRGRRHLTPRK